MRFLSKRTKFCAFRIQVIQLFQPTSVQICVSFTRQYINILLLTHEFFFQLNV